MAAQFKVGDHVRVIAGRPASAKGKVGTITAVPGDGTYGVLVPGHIAMSYDADELQAVQ